MAIRTLSTALLTVVALTSFAQGELFEEGLQDYITASNRLMSFDQVPITWTMTGDIQVELNEGINNLLEEHPGLAEKNFSEVLRKNPAMWQAWYYRAVCRKQLERYTDAQFDLQQLIARKQLLYESYLELGKVFLLQANRADAQKYFDKAAELQPDKAMAYYLKGNLALSQYRPRVAEGFYRDCLRRDSLFADARIKLALLQVTSPKNGYLAMSGLYHVLRYDSTNRYALFFRASLNFADEPELARRDLARLTKLWPANLMVSYLYGLILATQGDFERSFDYLHKVIDETYADENTFKGQQTWLDKRIDIQNAGAYVVSRVYGMTDYDGSLIRQAYCQLVVGNYGQAINCVNRATVMRKDPLCLFLKGVASEHLKRHSDAFQYYSAALAVDNDILDAHKKRGIYEQEMKQWESSIADFNDVLRINREVYVAYKLRGISYYHFGKFEKSVEDFTRYLKRDTADKETIGFRGMALMRSGRVLDAAIDFGRSENLHAIEFPLLSRALDSLLILGDTAKTLFYADRITKEVRFFSEGYAVKYKILARANAWDRIANDVDRAVVNCRLDASRDCQSYLFTVAGIVQGRGKHYDAAVDKFTEAIRIDQSNSLAYLERGKMLVALNKKSKAAADFEKAVGLGNKDAGALLAAMGKR